MTCPFRNSGTGRFFLGRAIFRSKRNLVSTATRTGTGHQDQVELERLTHHLQEVMLRDREALARRLKGLERRVREGKPVNRGLAGVRREIERSIEVVQQRTAQPISLNYPTELPDVAR